MGSGKIHWNVFDGVKIIAATPETLMAEINSAISNLEISRSTTLIDANEGYDACVADEAYKAGCAALPLASSMKLSDFSTSLSLSTLGEALRSLNLFRYCTPLRQHNLNLEHHKLRNNTLLLGPAAHLDPYKANHLGPLKVLEFFH
ncbi:Pentatricopeptide repeat-containing protein [Glycine soja]